VQENFYGIGMAEPVVSRVQQVKAAPGLALGGINRKAHCKNRGLPEMVGMAILTLGSRQEAVKRTTAVQQRFKLSLSQLREACRVLAGATSVREAVAGMVPGTEKQPVQMADVRAALVAEQLIDV
jgi:hypothetical protein